MLGALFKIHCNLHGWEFKEDKEKKVMCIDEIPFL